MKHTQRYQLDDGQHVGRSGKEEELVKKERNELVPGVPIVRSNTPRPISFETMVSSSEQFPWMSQGDFSSSMPVFPSKAPSAPPLPEELEESGVEATPTVPPADSSAPSSISRAKSSRTHSVGDAQEFIWLFEYGLEMDAAILNSPERLDGLALLYGPAVLRGYKVVLGAQRIHGSTGTTIIAIVPCSEPEAEVWGMLYRIPRRLTEPNDDEPSLLDTIHAAITPQKFFKGVQVVAHETFRDRDVTSVTYMATDVARQQLNLVSMEQWTGDDSLLQRLASIARKQKLPESYISQYEFCSQSSHIVRSAVPLTNPGPSQSGSEAPVSAPSTIDSAAQTWQNEQNNEQNTEPLLAIKERQRQAVDFVPSSFVSQSPVHGNRWLVAFSLYLVFLLFIALIFAIMQGLGFGSGVLTNNFMPLAVPWLVMMYGLVGGCISSLVTLGRFRDHCPPAFIIITWFTRPFIGAVLAVMSYLLLTSGIFMFGGAVNKHMAFFLLAGLLAGLTERWIFFKRG